MPKCSKNFLKGDYALGPILKALTCLEDLGSRWSFGAKVYYRLFYQSMIAKEAYKAGLEPGSRVLHIGCGALPYTALALASLGCEVVGLDYNPRAVDRARQCIAAMSFSDRISIQAGDGLEVDLSPYDAIWVSLNVFPREKIIQRAADRLSEGASLLYRNPRGWLNYLYSPVDLKGGLRMKQLLGKETVLWRRGNPVPTTQNSLTLDQLHAGCTGIILDIPPEPLLPPLGFRPGKEILMEGREICNGPLIACIEGRKIALDAHLARQITLTG